jgi:zinc protease
MSRASTAPRRTPPPVRPPSTAQLPRIERARLGTGTPVLFAPRRGVPLVDVHVVFRAGAGGDSPALAGRTALVAALLDEGTRTRPAGRIAEELEQVGARLDIRAGWDATTLALHVLAPNAAPALAVIGDVAAAASIPDEAFARKRAEKRAEWLSDRVEPGILASERLQHAIYGDVHPYAAPLNGTDSSLAALARHDVAAVHASRFGADNAFIVVVGDFEKDSMLDWLDSSFGEWRPGGDGADIVPDAPGTAGSIRVVPRPGAPQSEVRAGHAGPRRGGDDYFALAVLNTIIGGSFTSRLNRTLREEKGYTYGVRSSFALRGGPGPFTVAAAVFTDATADTVREIHTHVASVREEPVPEDELDRARRYLALGFPRLLESGDRIATQLVQAELLDLGSDFIERYVDRVLAVDADAVHAVALHCLDPGALHFAIAGDPDRIAATLSDLAIAPLLVDDGGDAHFRP